MRYYVHVLTQAGLLTLVSSVLFTLGLPNELFTLGNPLVGLVALVPFYLALSSVDSPRTAARLGALFGGVSTIIANYWLMFFREYSVWTIGGTTIGYIGYNFVLAGYLWVATRARRSYRPLLFALVWTAYEYLKSVGFLAYPWGLSAYPFGSLLRFTQLARITGVWGLSLLAVYANTTIAELLIWRPRRRVAGNRTTLAEGVPGAVEEPSGTFRRALAFVREHHAPIGNAVFTMLLVVATLVYGSIRMHAPIASDDTVDLILVQQNADAWMTSNISRPLLTSQTESEAALAEAPFDPELIVWSETSLRYLYVEGRDWYSRNPRENPFLTFVSELPAPLLTGAPYLDPVDDTQAYNAVIEIAQDTSMVQWYGKQHLVPFAEGIPFWNYAAVRAFFQSIIGLGGVWTPGPGARLFDITGNAGTPVRIGTPICFEDGFADVVRGLVRGGANLIVNLTNNSWSRTDSAQLQHFVAARYRAVETQRGLVRSTNSGYTCVVDPWGRVVASIPMFETGHLNVTVPVYTPTNETPYMLWGDYLPRAIIVLLAGLFAWWFVAGRLRARTKKEAPDGASS